MIAALLALAAGAFLWTLLEYVLHRVVFHELPGGGMGAAEHRRHHADPDYFAPAWQKGLAALAVTGVLLPAAWWVAGPVCATAFTGGFIGMYLGYEVLHRRCHTHPPRGAYGRWRRSNHFAHHFHDPRRGHGVTTPLWDRVFGTQLEVERVRVPRRLAMRWLVDENGAVHPHLEADYELVGSTGARGAASAYPRATRDRRGGSDARGPLSLR